MSPLPRCPVALASPWPLWLCRSRCWALGAGMKSPSQIALGFGLAGSCGVCHALALPGWAISFASVEQVVAPLRPRSTSHICLSQCHWAGLDPDGKQPYGCSVPQFPRLQNRDNTAFPPVLFFVQRWGMNCLLTKDQVLVLPLVQGVSIPCEGSGCCC